MKKTSIAARMVAIITFLALTACDKEKILTEDQIHSNYSKKLLATGVQVSNQNGILSFGCSDDFEKVQEALIIGDNNNQDSINEDLALYEFEMGLAFISLRQKVLSEQILWDQTYLTSDMSDEDYFGAMPEEREIIQDDYLATVLNPQREVIINNTFIKYYLDGSSISIVGANPSLISIARTDERFVTEELVNNPFVLIDNPKTVDVEKISQRDLGNGDILLIAPNPFACDTEWRIDDRVLEERDPYIVVNKAHATNIAVSYVVEGKSTTIKGKYSAGPCDAWEEELEQNGLVITKDGECGAVIIEYDLGAISPATIEEGIIDFGDFGIDPFIIEEGDPVRGTLEAVYTDALEKTITLSIVRAVSPGSNDVCEYSVDKKVIPGLNICCESLEIFDTTYTSGDYRLWSYFEYRPKNNNKKTKYFHKGKMYKLNSRDKFRKKRSEFTPYLDGIGWAPLADQKCGAPDATFIVPEGEMKEKKRKNYRNKWKAGNKYSHLPGDLTFTLKGEKDSKTIIMSVDLPK